MKPYGNPDWTSVAYNTSNSSGKKWKNIFDHQD